MYNRVILMGRLTKDPELKTTNSGVSVCSFTLAVDRKYAKDEKTDFFWITTFNKTAEFVSRYFSKGNPILVEGRLQTDEYKDKNGEQKRKTIVVADTVSFTGTKREISSGYESVTNGNNDVTKTGVATSGTSLSDFEEILSDGDLPF